MEGFKMTTGINDISQSRAARMAGIAWLIIIATGVLAEFFIRANLIVPGDAASTANNIVASEGLFRASIVSDLVMLVFDVVVALALYVLLRPVNRGLALLAAFFRLVMNAILGVNLLNLLIVLRLVGGTQYAQVFDTEQIHALASLFINAQSSGYDLSLVFFGIHLIIVAYLAFKSGYIPRVLGILLFAASFGYLIDSFANVLLPQEVAIISIVATLLIVLAVAAELSLSLWLVVRGSKIPDAQVAD
jgi:hypothetical protein